MKKSTVLERLTKVEVLLGNHLKHHDMTERFLLYPIAVGIVLLLVKVYFIK